MVVFISNWLAPHQSGSRQHWSSAIQTGYWWSCRCGICYCRFCRAFSTVDAVKRGCVRRFHCSTTSRPSRLHECRPCVSSYAKIRSPVCFNQWVEYDERAGHRPPLVTIIASYSGLTWIRGHSIFRSICPELSSLHFCISFVRMQRAILGAWTSESVFSWHYFPYSLVLTFPFAKRVFCLLNRNDHWRYSWNRESSNDYPPSMLCSTIEVFVTRAYSSPSVRSGAARESSDRTPLLLVSVASHSSVQTLTVTALSVFYSLPITVQHYITNYESSVEARRLGAKLEFLDICIGGRQDTTLELWNKRWKVFNRSGATLANAKVSLLDIPFNLKADEGAYVGRLLDLIALLRDSFQFLDVIEDNAHLHRLNDALSFLP